jgi:hypothetical protein
MADDSIVRLSGDLSLEFGSVYSFNVSSARMFSPNDLTEDIPCSQVEREVIMGGRV